MSRYYLRMCLTALVLWAMSLGAVIIRREWLYAIPLACLVLLNFTTLGRELTKWEIGNRNTPGEGSTGPTGT